MEKAKLDEEDLHKRVFNSSSAVISSPGLAKQIMMTQFVATGGTGAAPRGIVSKKKQRMKKRFVSSRMPKLDSLNFIIRDTG